MMKKTACHRAPTERKEDGTLPPLPPLPLLLTRGSGEPLVTPLLVDEFGLPLLSPQGPSLPPRARPSWASNPRQVLTGSASSSPIVHTSQDDIYHIQLGPQLQSRRSGDVPSLAATGKVVFVLYSTEMYSTADMQHVMSVPSACVNFQDFYCTVYASFFVTLLVKE